MSYLVNKSFLDKTDNRKLYKKGDSYTHENEERIASLIKQGFLKKKNKQPPGGIKHTGGGWYEISNGEKVKGKEAAQKAEAELK